MKRMVRPRISGVWLLAGMLGAGAAHAATNVDYNRDVRPILADKCYTCHGPDEKERKAGLRLDLEQEALKELKSGGRAIVRGDTAKSALVERITAQDEDDIMPPPKSGKKLTPAQIDVLKRWIEQGAPWQAHWSFVPPTRPALPKVVRIDWPRNPIDYFILERLEREGLSPSPPAGKETLIRRISYDLTGLPPSLEMVEAFVADADPDAYERWIDRLLLTQQYGERMAEHWMDLARYADTHGYHLDAGRDMWPWRDWVIAAFNANMPFDQFTLEQMAGDLLPEPTRSQILATGFHRNNMINFEGGAIPEEYLTHYVKDRVITTSTVYLGLTIGCAECHDHKYDPLTMRDFYRLYAYFNAVPEKGLDGSQGNAAPMLSLPTPAQEERLAQLKTRLESAQQRLDEILPEIDAAQQTWHSEWTASPRAGWDTLRPDAMASTGGATLRLLEDASILAGGTHPAKDAYAITARTDRAGLRVLRLEALTHESLPGTGPGRHENASFVVDDVSVQCVSETDPSQSHPVRFASARSDYSQKGLGVENLIDGKAETGWAIDAPERHTNGTAWLIAAEPFGFEGGTELRIQLDFGGSYPHHGLGRLRLAVTDDAREALPPEVAEALALAPSDLSEDQRKRLQKHYRERVSEAYRTHQEEITRWNQSIEAHRKEVATAMVMRQMEKPRDSFMLVRGQYDQPGEKVEPGVPASLPALPQDAPPDRLGLARWLTDPNHPLVARVTVNRFWQMILGTGLVKTANDFGSQGEWPSHPELLDWLAREFVESGWDVKHVLKLMVMSATYRQDSAVSEACLAKDPANRLYARGPRFRLSAEQIRDTALAVSGLLDGRVGGPSVNPYQPAGLWEELSSRQDSGNWSAQRFVQSEGADLYRRSLYTFWKRTCPPPSLAAFDAPDRETCIVFRERTSTPLQALILMNDPTYVESARALAERMMLAGGGAGAQPADRIAFAFRLATTRSPDTREVALLENLYHRQKARFTREPKEAERLLSVGDSPRRADLDPAEWAAWTGVASVILNLDETIHKG